MDDDESIEPIGMRPEVADVWAAVLIDVHEKRQRQKDDETGEHEKPLVQSSQP
jgi:hypothetical protein